MRVLLLSEPCLLRDPVLELLAHAPYDIRLLASDADDVADDWAGCIEAFAPPVVNADALADACWDCAAVIQLSFPTLRCPYGHELCLDFEQLRLRVEMCAGLGVRRFVSISAASFLAPRTFQDQHLPDAALEHLNRAHDAIARFPGEWLIIRPGLVYGPGDALVSPILTLLRRLVVLPRWPGEGRRLQPLWLRDVAEVVVRALTLREDVMRRTLRVGGPAAVTDRALYECAARLIGREPSDERLSKADTDLLTEIFAGYEDAPFDAEAAANLSRICGVNPTSLVAGLRWLVAQTAVTHTAGDVHRL